MSDPEGDPETEKLLDECEAWFIGNGIPHFIDDYTASEDVWTRTVEFLTLVFLAELALTFGGSLAGWAQAAAFLLGLGVVLTAVALLNRFRGRSPFARPNDIEAGELGLFVFVPPVLALIGGHNDFWGFVGVIGLNVALLVGTYIVVAWGLLSMTRWGLILMWTYLSQIVQLLGRILPLMLLFSAFLFLNAEVWQVVNGFTTTLFLGVLFGLVLIGLSFLTGAMRGAIGELQWFDSWEEVNRELDDTPLEGFDPCGFEGRPQAVPLSRKAKVNLTLRLVVGLAAQVLLVTLLIFGFYVLFGVITVRADTVLQWTTLDSLDDEMLASFSFRGDEIVLTKLHLVAAGFVASFSGLQFAVSLVTDSAFKRDFVDGSNAEVREAIAVRAVYLRLTKSL
ncbi:MAG: hypothetical protein HKN94_02540 [Acidimicrobiales bacterium]|nr:hypothetical protein [Acidimicrobiales bacterium]RZV44825.1 MAG: hypothetical protein EX269_11065 [Acidimicrobiales bacterium]